MILDDNEKSIELTMVDGATLRTDDMDGLLVALANLNTVRPVGGVVFAIPVLTVTMKDAVTFTITVNQAGQFKPNGTGYWTEDQFTLLRSLGDSILALVRNNGVQGVNIVYA